MIKILKDINDVNLISYLFILLLSMYLILYLLWIWKTKGGLRTEYRYLIGFSIGIFYNFWSAFWMRFDSLKLMSTLKKKISDPAMVKLIIEEYSGLLSTWTWQTRSLVLLFFLLIVTLHLRRETKTKRRCSDWNGVDRRVSTWNGILRRGDDVVENGI